ncbi:hypothetical protein PRK78_007165 [Emydomyces testavorans]|uniref:Translation initiation factor IF-3 n=1 Tax=Emydomyces testavorans TaxID=2070801 RepID=A0AAF0DNV8_9EURO|nr:hypothetical protein PRK78_007165 [Emydomyces testavorans]
MTHARPVFSAAQALRFTFLPPNQAYPRRPVPRGLNIYKSKRFNFSFRPPFDSSRSTPSQEVEPPKIPTTPSPWARRDDAIRHPRVRVVNEDGSLSSPMPLRQVLRTFDPIESSLVELIPASDSYGPICRVMSKKTLRELEYARSRPAKPKKAKLIELNWAIDPNDLEIRLKQMESFLAKGKKVELILTSKPRKRRATQPEAERVLALVKERIQKIGAVQSKPMQGEILGHAQFFLESKQST